LSASLESTSQSEMGPPSGPGLLFSLVAATVFPFDRVLAGMVGAGLGIEAICLYLGLTRAALEDGLVRLGLKTPHDRPLRQRGAKGWSTLDTMRLIAWRVAGVHPETIGRRLGRSTRAVRSKARRLGIPAPDRKLLRRLDPATLSDPLPGFAASAMQTTRPATISRPTGMCRTAAGAAWTPADAPSSRIVIPSPRQGGDFTQHAKVPNPSQQGELQLPRVIAPAVPNDPSPTPVVKPPIVDPDPTVRAAGDLRWIAGLLTIEADEEAVLLLSVRYFGGQHWKRIAAAAGTNENRMRTVLHRIWLPRDLDRGKFRENYSADIARATLKRSPYELRRDATTGKFFWRDRKDRGRVTSSRETRRANNQIDDFER
jgi:hypothetical protein